MGHEWPPPIQSSLVKSVVYFDGADTLLYDPLALCEGKKVFCVPGGRLFLPVWLDIVPTATKKKVKQRWGWKN